MTVSDFSLPMDSSHSFRPESPREMAREHRTDRLWPTYGLLARAPVRCCVERSLPLDSWIVTASARCDARTQILVGTAYRAGCEAAAEGADATGGRKTRAASSIRQ